MKAYKGFDENLHWKFNNKEFEFNVCYFLSPNNHENCFNAYLNPIDILKDYPNDGKNKYAIINCHGETLNNSEILATLVKSIDFVSYDELLKHCSGMITECNGDVKWYQLGKLHRDNDLPAIIDSKGNKLWYQYGKLHRENNLPAIIYVNNNMEWYYDGLKINYIYENLEINFDNNDLSYIIFIKWYPFIISLVIMIYMSIIL